MKLLRLFALLFVPALSFAQFTTVTGTVTDPNGLAYANGTISPGLVLPGGTSPTLNGLPYTPPSQPTGLDGAGKFTMRLADNTVLLPGSTQWTFLVCSAAGTIQPAGGKGPVCFNVPALTISGSSQSITSNISAVALALSTNPGTGTVTSSGSPVAGNIPKFTTATNIAPAAASDIVNLFSGCSGTLNLGADGACHAAGTGTVTSVTFTGDGTVLSSTPSSAVTTSGTLQGTLANAGANTVLGNATGGSAAPTYGQIVNGQIANGTINLTTKVTGVLPPANGATNNVTVSGQGYVLWPSITDFFAGSGGITASGGAGGTVRCGLMMLDRAITLTKMTVNVTTAVNTNKIYLGIYNAAGTTLLVQGTITMTASTGVYTATVSSTSLTPGAYWWAFSTDNVSVVMTGNNNPSGSGGLAVMNANTVIWGFSANSLSGGVLPASLGTVTANAAVLPLVKLEP
jgi:hypothetical protein